MLHLGPRRVARKSRSRGLSTSTPGIFRKCASAMCSRFKCVRMQNQAASLRPGQSSALGEEVVSISVFILARADSSPRPRRDRTRLNSTGNQTGKPTPAATSHGKTGTCRYLLGRASISRGVFILCRIERFVNIRRELPRISIPRTGAVVIGEEGCPVSLEWENASECTNKLELRIAPLPGPEDLPSGQHSIQSHRRGAIRIHKTLKASERPNRFSSAFQ